MSAKFYIGATLVALLGLGGWAIAEQQAEPATKAATPAENAAYVVSPAGSSAVLLDARSGKSWSLATSHDGQQVWLPIQRIDSDNDAHEWRQMQLAIKHRDDQERRKIDEDTRRKLEEDARVRGRKE